MASTLLHNTSKGFSTTILQNKKLFVMSYLLFFSILSSRLFLKGAPPPSNLCQGRFIPFMAPQHFQSLLHNNSTKPYCSLQLLKERSFVMRRGLDFVLRALTCIRSKCATLKFSKFLFKRKFPQAAIALHPHHLVHPVLT